MELTQSYIKEILSYDPDTGIFTWLPRTTESFASKRAAAIWHARYCGKQAGYNRNGYRVITIQNGNKNTLHQAHRLAFLYMTGSYPKQNVDHINGSEADNSWSNLREANQSVNMRNARGQKSNKTGIRGPLE